MSQPSQNPSSVDYTAMRLPSQVTQYRGQAGWTDADGKHHSMPYTDWARQLTRQNKEDWEKSRAKSDASTEAAPASPQDDQGEAAKEEPASSDSSTPPSPAPDPSRDPRLRGEEGSVSPCAGRDLPRSGASPDGPRPLPAQGLTQGQAAPDPFEPIRKFGLAARVRFLDCLAGHGEVRAAAARVGISRETAYRARRRWPDFAQLWDAALVHARTRAESELGTRALDGVEVPVFQRGEQVGSWRKHDARYLFTHLARLDRHVEANPDAVKRAERFDEMLAAMAGHELPEHFAEACPEENIEGVPPTRAAFVEQVCGQALGELDENGEEIFEGEEERLAAEAEAVEWATTEAGAEHDLWVDGAFAKLDGVLEGEDECEDAAGDVPLIEYKAIMPGSALRTKLRRSVSHVSTGGSKLPLVPRANPHSVRAEERAEAAG